MITILEENKMLVKEPLNNYTRNPMKNLEFELKVRGYSQETVKAYVLYNKRFLKFIKKSPKRVRQNDIKIFIEYMLDKGFEKNTINLAISALLFYYREILGRRFHIKRVKREERLYSVLSRKEVNALINSISNQKHKLLFQLFYSTGLRVSEAVKLKTNDLDFERKIGYVRSGKGARDRIFPLNEQLINDIQIYLANRKRSSIYLFDTRYGHLSRRSAEELCKRSAKRLRINKSITPHTMRRTFGTHHIEKGTSIYTVQKLMGHKDVRTTEGYIKNAKVDYQENLLCELDN
ncbi:tyrosine-type recombinase/integrase [Candidatus Woesearchaeota archaeon]|nr:tyrosine-type recombinase/integrase [Candidatus Woesearchaeota archaeon]